MNIYRHTDPVRSFQLNDIMHCDLVLSANWLANAEQFGVPSEIVHRYYNDRGPLQVNYDPVCEQEIKVLYVSVEDHVDELQYLLQVISLFNEVPSVALTVYCSQKHYALIKDFSNEHIVFAVRSIAHGLVTLSTNVIITYGPRVLHFLKQGVPVIVMGPYGFGGWVTAENLPYLPKNGFLGRPGGTAGEPVPAMLLVQQLLQLKQCENAPQLLALTQQLANHIPCRPLSKMDKVIEYETGLQRQLEDEDLRWRLIPRLASNIVFTENKTQVFIKRKMINDTVCVIAKDDKPFFERMNGETDCTKLYKLSEMSTADFWETVHSLKSRKILLF